MGDDQAGGYANAEPSDVDKRVKLVFGHVAKSNDRVEFEHSVDLSFEYVFDRKWFEKPDDIQCIIEPGHAFALSDIALVKIFLYIALNVFQQLWLAVPPEHALG